MVDTQNSRDDRNLPLDKVGIKGLRYPITVLDKTNGTQATQAEISMYADLPHHFRGTHMSRFIEVFNEYYKNIQMNNFLEMVEKIRSTLDAEHAFVEMKFPYFIEKSAPVTGQKSMMDYACKYIGETVAGRRSFFVAIEVPVTTLCPCSREISDFGAHNQRGTVSVELKLGDFFWIEDIISLIEGSASSDLYTLLKREDEKYVTEQAYNNPRFVEDIVREVVIKIEKKYRFPWFSVEAENMESIHNHNAYARLERGRRL